MKGFLKSIFASIIGCSIVLFIFFFFMFAAIASIIVSSDSVYDVKENTVLTLKLEGNLTDRSNFNPLNKIIFDNDVKEILLGDVISSIKKAKDNDKIKGIYIEAGMMNINGASALEIREQLLDFKQSGKFIVAYGDIYTQQCYYLASIANKVILNPQGIISFEGNAALPTFYKGLLDKLGVEVEVFKVGTFKSAVEPFIDTKMSDASRLQTTSYINDLWKTTLNGISNSRNISIDSLNILADNMPIFQDANFYLNSNMVDTLMYETEVKSYIKTLMNVENDDDMQYTSVDKMNTVPIVNKSKTNNEIAILYAEGTIYDGSGKSDIYSKYYISELNKLKDNDNVKAVVLKINSPGGSAYASEQIWKAVDELKKKKPIVVSMGNVAASGGYYIACNASKIIAQPNTITGSIGIFGMIPNFEGLFGKVGLTHDVVKTNKFSDMGNVSRKMTTDEKQHLQLRIERGYDLFLTRCSEGRNIPKDSLDLIAQGRVWTGNQALEIGLVDAIGGLDLAIEEAAKLAEISDYNKRSYPAKVDFVQELLSSYINTTSVGEMKQQFGSAYKYFEILKEMENQDIIQARIPYNMSVY